MWRRDRSSEGRASSRGPRLSLYIGSLPILGDERAPQRKDFEHVGIVVLESSKPMTGDFHFRRAEAFNHAA